MSMTPTPSLIRKVRMFGSNCVGSSSWLGILAGVRVLPISAYGRRAATADRTDSEIPCSAPAGNSPEFALMTLAASCRPCSSRNLHKRVVSGSNQFTRVLPPATQESRATGPWHGTAFCCVPTNDVTPCADDLGGGLILAAPPEVKASCAGCGSRSLVDPLSGVGSCLRAVLRPAAEGIPGFAADPRNPPRGRERLALCVNRCGIRSCRS